MSTDQAEPHHGRDRPERHRKPGGRSQPERSGRPGHQRGQNQPVQDSPGRAVPMYPVIVGYDGSRSARNALAYAAGMARRQDQPLLAVCVMPAYGPATLQGVPVVRDAEAVERWLLTELDEVASPVGLRVHVRARWGSPARELSELAIAFSAQALVIGASTRSWHRLAGSVPGWLATHASCPVIVIP